MNESPIAPDASFEYYRGEIYWNNFNIVNEHHNRIITGQKDKSWIWDLRNRLKDERAFLLNCGNGWVERDLFKAGVIKSAAGCDINQQLLDLAKNEANAIGLDAEYFCVDVNTMDAPDDTFGLVVNFAAMHHVAFINRTMEILSRATGTNGHYVSYDYVGPHRNQYSTEAWFACEKTRLSLPEKYRTILRYPHIRTMLSSDPSEAVHSELEEEVQDRYFSRIKSTRLGGALLYPILYGNKRLFQDQDTPEGREALHFLIEEDCNFLKNHPETNLFTFSICKSKRSTINESQVNEWQEEENIRESISTHHDGRYYSATGLELIYNVFYDREDSLKADLASAIKTQNRLEEGVELQ